MRQKRLPAQPRPDLAGDHCLKALPARTDVRGPKASPRCRGAQSPGTPLHRRPPCYQTPGAPISKGCATQEAPTGRHQAHATPPPHPRCRTGFAVSGAPPAAQPLQATGRRRPKKGKTSGGARPDKTAESPSPSSTHHVPLTNGGQKGSSAARPWHRQGQQPKPSISRLGGALLTPLRQEKCCKEP
ncbi:hypothetical protein NDU88_004175 [Pleurodeles waltl]|uniref:Uncharacterized protein n=1 Tax=Pleurodeles waltl TaxID=8319 RepID=A0AAV7MU46_PLEWA|nr:hypothetical protein NDU88_004175 [Pleurodeles waltl]